MTLSSARSVTDKSSLMLIVTMLIVRTCADVEARKKAKRAGINAEDLEYEIEDMTPETVCLCLAANQDEYSFRLKVGKFVSPPLHLLQVRDVDPESGKILWQ
ncbi:hypothetical protein CYMTET_39903 [Cymbomonas tetramitiformis]|uniref:Uncharacterized protein n=1 Tax=Cymbomonas tetramitiformis TaxID=36881 RepID=A0AAE0CAX7_9CHLO|nr:hypothetical protein CYMTET_39903 [Cymbomonas tetramitiformis]